MSSGPNPSGRGAERSALKAPVLVRYESVIDFVEMQSLNVSLSGMFLTTDDPLPQGSVLSFRFELVDGYVLLEGQAEVVRRVTTGIVKGMGLRFTELDQRNRAFIQRIVSINNEEGRLSTVTFDFSKPATTAEMPAVSDQTRAILAAPAQEKPILVTRERVRIRLDEATAKYFTYNPLLNIRMGGFFVPADEDVPLGAVLAVEIVDTEGTVLLAGKGKVAAKQELRIGVRMTDTDKQKLAWLQQKVAKLSTGTK